MSGGRQDYRVVDFAGLVPVNEPWTTVSRSRRRNEAPGPRKQPAPRDPLRANTSSMLANATNPAGNGTFAPGAKLLIFSSQDTASANRTSSRDDEKITEISAANFMAISRRFEFFVRNNEQFNVYKLDMPANVIDKDILLHFLSWFDTINFADVHAGGVDMQVSCPSSWSIPHKLRLYRFTQWLWLQGGAQNTDLYSEMKNYIMDSSSILEPSALLAIWRESSDTDNILRTSLIQRCVRHMYALVWASGTENEHAAWLKAFAVNKTLYQAYKEEYDKAVMHEIRILQAEEAERKELEKMA